MLQRSKSATLIYFAAFIGLGMFAAVLGPTLPNLAENTRSRLGEVGFLFTTRSFGYLVGSLISGRAFDRLSGHLLLGIALICMGGIAALIPLSPYLWLLVLLMFVVGLAEGAVDIGANLLLVWSNPRQASPYLNALHFFFGLGAFLSPILVAQSIIRSGDIAWAFWILALYPLPLAAILFRLASPSPPATLQEQSKGEIPVRLVAAIGVIFFLYVGAEAGFGGWIYTYTTKLGLGDIASAAYLTSVFWGSLTVGRLIGIPLAARFPTRAILLTDLSGCLVSIGAIILFPKVYAVVWAGAIGLGLFMASIYPTLLAFADKRMTLSGEVTRWFFVGTGAGGMFLPWIMGRLFENKGPQAIMIAVLIDLTLALIVFLWSIKESTTLQQPE